MLNRLSRILVLMAIGSFQIVIADDQSKTGCKSDPKDLGVAMYLQNFQGCFISRKFADRLARVYVEEKYDSALFVAGNGDVVDGDLVHRHNIAQTIGP